MKIKAIVFDMGGVLLRTMDGSRREEMARRFGTTRRELEKTLFLSPTSIQSEVGQLSDIDHWRAVLQHYQQPEEDYHEAYTGFFSGDEIDAVFMDYIRALKVEYRVGLLSNAWMNARQNLGKLYDFIDVFDVSIFSAEVGLRKPDKRIFQLMLEKLGVEAQETIFVDDFAENISGAAALGMQAILFREREQAIQEINQLLGKC